MVIFTGCEPTGFAFIGNHTPDPKRFWIYWPFIQRPGNETFKTALT